MESILDTISLTTDIDKFSSLKKVNLFNELNKKLSSSSGNLSKENRFVIDKLCKSYSNLVSKLKSLNEENEKNKLEITNLQESLNKKSTSVNPLSYNFSPKESYSNVLQNSKTEFPVVIKNVSGLNLDVEEEICKKLKESKKNIDILKIKKREDKIIINTRNDLQQELIIEKLSADARFDCKKPSKLIPSIMISRISKKWSEAELLDEICQSEGIKKENSTIKILPTNPLFKTNRAILKCSKDDTLKLNERKEVKIGFLIHPIRMIHSVTQCYGCHGFNHFEFNKERTIKTCKNISRCGHCASDQHRFKECPDKNDLSKAKCCNCDGKHRSNSNKCKKRENQEIKIKPLYLC